LWGMPSSVVSAVALHHDPALLNDLFDEIIFVSYMGGVIADVLIEDSNVDIESLSLYSEYCKKFCEPQQLIEYLTECKIKLGESDE